MLGPTVPQEVALAPAIGNKAAYHQVDLAEALITRLPHALDAKRRGEIDASPRCGWIPQCPYDRG